MVKPASLALTGHNTIKYSENKAIMNSSPRGYKLMTTIRKAYFSVNKRVTEDMCTKKTISDTIRCI